VQSAEIDPPRIEREAEYVEIAEARIGVLIRSPLVQREEK